MSENTTTASVLEEVSAERERQNAKWGEQNHTNGTGAGNVFFAAVMGRNKTPTGAGRRVAGAASATPA